MGSQSSSLKEMTLFLIPIIQHGFLVGMQIWISDQFSTTINYISKYVSKAETQSKSYQEILQTVVGQVNDNARVAIVYQKMLSSLVGERDISGKQLFHLPFTINNISSAQEVCYTLFGCPMWVSSRQYCTLKVSEGSSDEVTFGQCPNSVSLY